MHHCTMNPNSLPCDKIINALNDQSGLHFTLGTSARFSWKDILLLFHGHKGSCTILQTGNHLFSEEGAFLEMSMDKCSPPDVLFILTPEGNVKTEQTLTIDLYGQLFQMPGFVRETLYTLDRVVVTMSREVSCKEMSNFVPFSPNEQILKLGIFKKGTQFCKLSSTGGDTPLRLSISATTPSVHVLHTLIIEQYRKASLHWMDIHIQYQDAPNQGQTSHFHLSPGINELYPSSIKSSVLAIGLCHSIRQDCMTQTTQTHPTPISIEWNSTKIYDTLCFSATFQSVVSLSCSQPIQYVSLPWTARSITVTVHSSASITLRNNLTYHWVFDQSVAASENGESTFLEDKTKGSIPFVITSLNNASYYIFHRAAVLHPFLHFENGRLVHEKQNHHSWDSASELCEKIGGNLPVLLDQKDTEELVTLFIQREVAWVRAMYIGLKVMFLFGCVRNLCCSKPILMHISCCWIYFLSTNQDILF